MEIYLIRHTSIVISPGHIYGRSDVPLGDTFEKEKDLVIKSLPSDIEKVYTSPSERCTKLAEYISPNNHPDERLTELNFGSWEGENWNTVDRISSDWWMEDYINRSPPEGETMKEMQIRVLSFWNEKISAHYQTIAIVTHGGVIRIIRGMLSNMDLKDCFNLNVGFGEVFRVEV